MIDAYDLHYVTRDGRVEIILKNVRLYCSSCQKWRAGSQFGLRDMASDVDAPAGGSGPARHVIRNQPQCQKCRNDSAKVPSRATKAKAKSAAQSA